MADYFAWIRICQKCGYFVYGHRTDNPCHVCGYHGGRYKYTWDAIIGAIRYRRKEGKWWNPNTWMTTESYIVLPSGEEYVPPRDDQGGKDGEEKI